MMNIDKLLLEFGENIRNILKGVERITITPNTNSYDFNNDYAKIDEKNPNICITSCNVNIYSNEELPGFPIKDE